MLMFSLFKSLDIEYNESLINGLFYSKIVKCSQVITFKIKLEISIPTNIAIHSEVKSHCW